MNMLSIRVAVVLEILVGGIICGINLYQKSISRTWYLSRFKLKSPFRIVLFLFFDYIEKVVHKVIVKFKVFHVGMFINPAKYITLFIWKGHFNEYKL